MQYLSLLSKLQRYETSDLWVDKSLFPHWVVVPSYFAQQLTILPQIRSYQPTEWEELLKSVRLDAIAQAPFAEYRAAEQ